MSNTDTVIIVAYDTETNQRYIFHVAAPRTELELELHLTLISALRALYSSILLLLLLIIIMS